jgi:HK97 family phage prohead protease
MRRDLSFREAAALFCFPPVPRLRLERKSVAAEYKADLTKREVTGYASTFGNIDRGDDRIIKGAYTKTLAHDFPAGQIKVRRNHDGVIGKPIHMEQDSKGLLTVSRISDTALGNETLCLVEDGVIDRMSIGYSPEEKRYVNEDGRKVRELVSVRLSEYSLLDQPPMNAEAAITGIKSLDDVMRVFDQMASALYSLRNLASVPPDVLARLGALMQDIETISDTADQSADQDQLASLSATLSNITSILTNRRS